eukprot:1985175-Heterocapsa_arctica.AAC.1
MLENYKDNVFHNKEEAESKRRKSQLNTNHSDANCEIDTQEYDKIIGKHQEAQVGDDGTYELGVQENNQAEDDIDTQEYGEETQQVDREANQVDKEETDNDKENDHEETGDTDKT